jgi:hypothetical protein
LNLIRFQKGVNQLIMATFLFSNLPIEVEKMIVQTATTKKNKVLLNKQLNNMRRQFYEDQWYDDNEWVAKTFPEVPDDKKHWKFFTRMEQEYQQRQNENFYSNFIKPCRRRLTVGGEIEYWDYEFPSGDYFINIFGRQQWHSPKLRPSNRWWNGLADEDYPDESGGLNTYMVPLEDCIWH